VISIGIRGRSGLARSLLKGTGITRIRTPMGQLTRVADKRMNMLQAKGIWYIAKGRLEQQLARFTHDDRQFIKGKEDELIGRIQRRTGQVRTKIHHVKTP